MKKLPANYPPPDRPVHNTRRSLFHLLPAILSLACLTTACQVLTYTAPTGERFSRTSLGARTAISSLTVEAATNGLRRVEVRGYSNDSTQVLGTVTEAAVRAAIAGAK